MLVEYFFLCQCNLVCVSLLHLGYQLKLSLVFQKQRHVWFHKNDNRFRCFVYFPGCADKNGEQDAIVAAVIITATIILAVLAFFFWRCSTRRRGQNCFFPPFFGSLFYPLFPQLISSIFCGLILGCLSTNTMIQRLLVRVAGRSVSSMDKLFYTKMLELHGNNREFNDLLLFKFEKLAVATNNFHESNKLGRGGFGPVFKVT